MGIFRRSAKKMVSKVFSIIGVKWEKLLSLWEKSKSPKFRVWVSVERARNFWNAAIFAYFEWRYIAIIGNSQKNSRLQRTLADVMYSKKRWLWKMANWAIISSTLHCPLSA